jgi:hypothetical protein
VLGDWPFLLEIKMKEVWKGVGNQLVADGEFAWNPSEIIKTRKEGEK